MKKAFTLILSFLLVSCFTEPKKEENKTEIEYEEPEYDYGKTEEESDSLAIPVEIVEEVKKDKTIPLQTFDVNSRIYSDYDGCGCYFSIDKDNYIAGKKFVFFGELLGKEGNSIELIIDDKIEKLYYEGSKKTSDTQLVFAYSNSNHLAGIIIERENIENEETTFWSGSISVDNKLFSLIFGMCGC